GLVYMRSVLFLSAPFAPPSLTPRVYRFTPHGSSPRYVTLRISTISQCQVLPLVPLASKASVLLLNYTAIYIPPFPQHTQLLAYAARKRNGARRGALRSEARPARSERRRSEQSAI